MDVNYNMQSGTSIPLADIVESGSGYIKFSNGIAIVYLGNIRTYGSWRMISPGIYEIENIIDLPIGFTSVSYFLMSIYIDTYAKTSSESFTITRNIATTKYNAMAGRRFTATAIMDMSGYAVNTIYSCSFDIRTAYTNYFIIGRWK